LPTNHELARLADTSYVNVKSAFGKFEGDPCPYAATGAGAEGDTVRHDLAPEIMKTAHLMKRFRDATTADALDYCMAEHEAPKKTYFLN
jgi:hypothetical protein